MGTGKPRMFPRVQAEDVLPSLQEMQRLPFMEILALVLACRPTPEDLLKFSSLYPDRWANAIAVFARLSGYSDKLDVTQTTNLNVRIAHMSDAELAAALEEMRLKDAAVAALPPPMQDALADIRADITTAIPTQAAEPPLAIDNLSPLKKKPRARSTKRPRRRSRP